MELIFINIKQNKKMPLIVERKIKNFYCTRRFEHARRKITYLLALKIA